VAPGRGISAGAGLGIGTLFLAPAAADADDFRVTTLGDDHIVSPAGSLREAVESASATPGADRILFSSRLSGTIHLDPSGSALYLPEPVEILGPGARKLTVEAASRAFYIGPGGDATISGLTLRGGDTGVGGAIFHRDSDLTLERATLTGNQASRGAGIYSAGSSANLVVENSTISGNSAFRGSGIYSADSDLSIRSSTISGNSADSAGGGVYKDGGALEVRNSTVTRNSADQGGGLREVNVTEIDLLGSIIADNQAPFGPDVAGGLWNASFSLIGDTSNGIFDLGPGNVLNADAKLKPLANNGGPTDTHAFKKSPAKNKGPSDAPNQDQRGAPRKGKPDIGAYELTKCKGVIVNRVGTAGKDKLKGTKRKDGILGLGGNDKLSGKKGRDGLCGGQGKDKLKGGRGEDKLNGGPGKDKEIQ
jgi:parallel beta helix pectate lyase-like protein/hemolysin type calcium-binding protein